MRRRIAFTLTAAIVAVFLCPPQAGASARGDAWRAVALEAWRAARYGAGTSETPHFYAAQTATAAWLYGWDHVYTTAYVTRVLGMANPDGGWGLNSAYDAFQDGTVNAADTTYTVTLTDHVGPVLLAGYRAGVVARARVQTVVDLLMSTPRVPVPRGVCVAYSRSAYDAAAGCVHNVNAGVGSFLQQAAAAGLGATGMHRLIADITVAEVDAYLPAAIGWPYIAGQTTVQDADHNAYSAESVLRLAYWVGREVAHREATTDSGDPVAHLRLVSLPGGVAGTSGTTTLWCVLGDQWMGEVDAYVSGTLSPRQWAQAGYLAARAWQACA